MMIFEMKKLCLLVLVLLPAVCFSAFVPSKATIGDASTGGACGYGEAGRTMNNGLVTSVSQKLWRNGAVCGACYQVKCTNKEYCNSQGVTVAVTNQGGGGELDFVINRRAFVKIARPGDENKLISAGVVNILYQRVPCRYSGNVLIKVHQDSRFPDYLSVVLLNVAGVNEVLAIEVKSDRGYWNRMTHVFGAVYALSSPPRGQLSVRVLVRIKGKDTWKQGTNVIPSQWKPGQTYDSTFQLN